MIVSKESIIKTLKMEIKEAKQFIRGQNKRIEHWESEIKKYKKIRIKQEKKQ